MRFSADFFADREAGIFGIEIDKTLRNVLSCLMSSLVVRE
jgi:hypothetical protein